MTSALRRLWWLPALAAAAALSLRDTGADAGDVVFFAHAGARLFGGAWAGVYADPTLQSGPLQLAALGALAHLAGASGLSLGSLFAPAIEIAGAAGLAYVFARVVRGRPVRREVVLGIAALAAVALGLPQSAWLDGHPAQLAIPLLWVLAALDARRGRPLRAGLLVGASAGLELWGLLGACVLAAAPRLRNTAGGLGVAASAFVLPLVPFLLVGDFRMLSFSWHVASGTAVSLVLPAGSPYPWPLRLLQAAAALGAGALAARRLRLHDSVVWAAPLAAVLVRFVFDPVFYASYLLAPLTLVVIGAVDLLTGPLVRTALAARSERRGPGQGAAAIRR